MSDATNRLATETSLYLRQHAKNPVDWFPWGPEALAKARELDRPIFLSVGYSACHWCHVMEHECFENEAIAAAMNDHFVCVKVDREERPDLDSIYMTAHHLLNRGEGGGWPLSVFLAPDLTPFYAGTYFPPDDRYMPQRPSFPALLTAIDNAWANQRDRLREIGQSVVGFLTQAGETGPTDRVVPVALVTDSLRTFQRSFDAVHGGFGTQPKFPHSVDLRLLLRVHARTGSAQALDMVTLSLTKMARGGVYDQVGGGFHRYSVDAHWLVPHFEKMLYDNALLAQAYTEAFQVTGDECFKQVAGETLDYVLREMTCPGGGFYSTQDADSEGEEGKFFVWSLADVERVVGPDSADIAVRTFGVTEGGNFEGHNILCRSRSDADEAKRQGIPVEEFRDKLAAVKCALYGERAKRIHPGRDEKILTGWNGLMIAAFAQAGAAFGDARYVEAAGRAADFVLANLRGPDGRLFRTCGVGQPAKLTGYLEDYAYLADGLLTLHEAGQDRRYLHAARDLAGMMVTHFADTAAGNFYFTAADHEELIARTKDLHDNATPAANAMAVTVLVRLNALAPDAAASAQVARTLSACKALMEDSPQAASQLLLALDRHAAPSEEFVVVGPAGSPEVAAALRLVQAKFRPHATVLVHDPAAPADALLPQLAAMTNPGDVTLYHCRDFACAAPAVGLSAIETACR